MYVYELSLQTRSIRGAKFILRIGRVLIGKRKIPEHPDGASTPRSRREPLLRQNNSQRNDNRVPDYGGHTFGRSFCSLSPFSAICLSHCISTRWNQAHAHKFIVAKPKGLQLSCFRKIDTFHQSSSNRLQVEIFKERGLLAEAIREQNALLDHSVRSGFGFNVLWCLFRVDNGANESAPSHPSRSTTRN